MEREMRVRLEVEEPGALPVGARHAGDDEPAVHVVKDDLDAAGRAGLAAGRRDVDAVTARERVADLVVHGVRRGSWPARVRTASPYSCHLHPASHSPGGPSGFEVHVGSGPASHSVSNRPAPWIAV